MVTKCPRGVYVEDIPPPPETLYVIRREKLKIGKEKENNCERKRGHKERRMKCKFMHKGQI
jgi:hypothetical protein